MSTKEIAIVSPEELSLVTGNLLNEKQLSFLLKKTPEKYVRKRPAKGGGEWEYVTGGYVKKCLNLMFGWNWSFEITEQLIMHGEAIVKGRLSCTTNGVTIVKTQFGNKDIMCKRGTEIPLSIGNDLKAAATDCLKKCAAELGIASDIYNKEEFRELKVEMNTYTLEDLKALYGAKKDNLNDIQQAQIESIINDNDTVNFKKTFNRLKSL